MIEVKDLVKDYGGHLAVDHLSFTLEDGRIYGFLGPNGAGKSTTMNIMTGYLGATEGDVFIDGHDILEEPEEAKRCIGYLPELPPLYLEMTVREYLNFAAQLKKIPKAERRQAIDEVTELTMLADVENRLIKNLSKGYRQRVGLAQAVLGMPPVIILDEPTVGLDPKQIIEIRDLIRRLGEKHTVILSSHILSEVSEVCDYILIIAHGRLIASDTPENLERQMAGARGLELLIKGGREEVEKVLSRIPEAVDIQLTEPAEGWEEGIVRAVMQFADSQGSGCDGVTEEKPGLDQEETGKDTGEEPRNDTEVEAGNETGAEPRNKAGEETGNETSDDAGDEVRDTDTLSDKKNSGFAADVRERIFYAFADARLPILNMQATKASLEEVFLELTAEEQGGIADSDAEADEGRSGELPEADASHGGKAPGAETGYRGESSEPDPEAHETAEGGRRQ